MYFYIKNNITESSIKEVLHLSKKFGLAKVADLSQKLTHDRLILGTPAYMSPEQSMGLNLDATADLYGMAMVFFELAAGRLPFETGGISAQLYQKRHHDAISLRSVNPALPEIFYNVIDNLLQRDRRRRMQSAEEVLAFIRFQRSPFLPLKNVSKKLRKVMMTVLFLGMVGGIITIYQRNTVEKISLCLNEKNEWMFAIGPEKFFPEAVVLHAGQTKEALSALKDPSFNCLHIRCQFSLMLPGQTEVENIKKVPEYFNVNELNEIIFSQKSHGVILDLEIPRLIRHSETGMDIPFDKHSPVHMELLLRSLGEVVLNFKDSSQLLFWMIGISEETRQGWVGRSLEDVSSQLPWLDVLAAKIKAMDSAHPVAIRDESLVYSAVIGELINKIKFADIFAIEAGAYTSRLGELAGLVRQSRNLPVFGSALGSGDFLFQPSAPETDVLDYLNGPGDIRQFVEDHLKTRMIGVSYHVTADATLPEYTGSDQFET